MHYYQFNIADYRKDTTHLSRLEHSIYRDLIDMYYLDESSIHDDMERLYRRLRLVTEDEKMALELVLNDFFYLDGDQWTHERCDKEIIEFKSKQESASKAGKASAAKRLHNEESTHVEHPFNDCSTTVQPTINQEPLTKNQVKSRGATASRLPADWYPSDDDFLFCRNERPDLTPSEVANRFRDYWIAMPGSKGRKLDWPATWRNWVRNEKPINGKTQRQLDSEATTRAIFGNMLTPIERVISGEVVK